jgi:NAD(P)-dependent dehydrogenase (short-subunit alcohol dehydrogenase family)
MLEREQGWILNMSSQTAVIPTGPPFPATHPARHGTMYGGTKALLNRWTASLAVEVVDAGIAVNTLAPQAAAATELLVEYSDLDEAAYEPLETMAEASLALCSAGPRVLTGRVATSLELLCELDRPVRTLDGSALMDGWQPDDLPDRIAAMSELAHGPPSNVDAVLGQRTPS